MIRNKTFSCAALILGLCFIFTLFSGCACSKDDDDDNKEDSSVTDDDDDNNAVTDDDDDGRACKTNADCEKGYFCNDNYECEKLSDIDDDDDDIDDDDDVIDDDDNNDYGNECEHSLLCQKGFNCENGYCVEDKSSDDSGRSDNLINSTASLGLETWLNEDPNLIFISDHVHNYEIAKNFLGFVLSNEGYPLYYINLATFEKKRILDYDVAASISLNDDNIFFTKYYFDTEDEIYYDDKFLQYNCKLGELLILQEFDDKNRIILPRCASNNMLIYFIASIEKKTNYKLDLESKVSTPFNDKETFTTCFFNSNYLVGELQKAFVLYNLKTEERTEVVVLDDRVHYIAGLNEEYILGFFTGDSYLFNIKTGEKRLVSEADYEYKTAWGSRLSDNFIVYLSYRRNFEGEGYYGYDMVIQDIDTKKERYITPYPGDWAAQLITNRFVVFQKGEGTSQSEVYLYDLYRGGFVDENGKMIIR